MSFNKFFLESGNFYKVLRRATDEEINEYLKRGYTLPEDIEGAWLMHIKEDTEDRNSFVIYTPERGEYPYVLYMPEIYLWDGKDTENGPVAKAIKNWETLQAMSPETRDSFGGFLDVL
jgi:hypothetical protein